MKNQTFLFRLVVLLAAMMCALGAAAVEAYANYTPSNTTLTFYYDNYRSSRTGTTYDLNTGNTDVAWDTDGTNASVTKVVFDSSFANARPTTTYDWFYNMRNLETIQGIGYLNTSEVTNMAYMFFFCFKLTNLDLRSFNTSKVVNMRSMFSRCSGLKSINLSSFNTSKVTNMYNLFFDCSDLATIYVGSGWSTAAVTKSEQMFYNCTYLVGGKGTTYDENHVDKDYAHIDGGPSNPGYLTEFKEAYACYTPSNTTLTFYYDNYRSSRSGTTYDLNTGANDPGWKTDGTNADVTKVVFDPSFAAFRPTTTRSWFSRMQNLQSITGMKEYLNTSEVTNMAYMFWDCVKLTSLDVSHFNTSNVTDMYAMFSSCIDITSLDLSSFNTSKVTNMSYMFYPCRNLQTIYVGSGWSTAAVTYSSSMFFNCTSLVGGQGTAYNSSNPMDKTYAHIDGGTNNPGYFTVGTEAYACYTPSNTTLTFYYDNQRIIRTGATYDLNTGSNDTGWDTDGTKSDVTKVVFDPSFADARPTTTYDWFYGMGNLQSITGMKEYLNTSEVTNMAHMFNGCSRLNILDVSHFNTSKVTDMRSMFRNCSSLTSLDLSSFNTSKVTDIYNMFYGCSSLRTIYAGRGWSTAAVTNSTYMFYDCTSLVGGQGTTYSYSNPTDKTYAHIDGGPSNPGYFTAFTEAYACYTPSNTTLTFYYDDQRFSRPGTTYDLNTGDNITDWYYGHTNASVTKVVFDPSFANARPTTTYTWFYDMGSLQSITGMNYLNTSEVTNMAHMFNTCSSLTGVDLSGFNTSKVTDMQVMFYNCAGLTSLDLSSFNTSNVTNMFNMFGGCSGLTSLDMSSFNTSKVTDMGYMFYSCFDLGTIYVGSGWSTAAVTYSSSMFFNCTSLVGGQGTTYDANHVDAAYAHIDGGTSNPGYFTDKNAGLRGDVNGDGSVNISDVTALIDLLLGGGTISNPAADCNQDSSVNISDVTALIDFLLSGSW